MEYSIYNTDCMKLLPTLESKSVQCIITDLPYDVVTSFGQEREKYNGQLRKLNKGKKTTIKSQFKGR